MNHRTKKRFKRVGGLSLYLCMVLSCLPGTAFAVTEDGLCEHHPEHTEECGYAAAVEAQPCTHIHTDDCYFAVSCIHEHDEDCKENCTHICSEESESGKLTNGSDELAFTNTLAEGNLTKTGDTLAGTVEVTDSPSNPGKYIGTIDFVINYYAGE